MLFRSTTPNTVDLSTARLDRDVLPPLVNVQSERVVKVRSARTRLAQAWCELERADVLQGTAFAHDLVHEAARRAVPTVIAQHLHRSVASHLEAAGAEPARVAPHWWNGQKWEAAARSFEDAARGAARVGRLSEQAEFLAYVAMARFHLGQTDEGLASACDAVISAASSDGPAAARRLCDRLASTSGRDAADPALQVMLGFALLLGGDYRAALEAARPVLDAPPGLPASLRLDAGLVCALAMTSVGETATGVEMVERVAKEAEAVDRPAALLRFHSIRCSTLLCHRRYAAAEQAARHGLRLARETGVLDEEISALDNLGSLMERRGDLKEARVFLTQARELVCDRKSFAMLARWNDLRLAMCLGGLGEFKEALAIIQAVALELPQLGADPGIQHAAVDTMARIYLAMGQTARAVQTLVDGQPEDEVRKACRLEVRAAIAQALGQDARALIDEGLGFARSEEHTSELQSH